MHLIALNVKRLADDHKLFIIRTTACAPYNLPAQLMSCNINSTATSNETRKKGLTEGEIGRRAMRTISGGVDVYRSHEQLSVVHHHHVATLSFRRVTDATRQGQCAVYHRISPYQQDEVRHRPHHETKNTQSIVRIGRHMASLLRSTPIDDMCMHCGMWHLRRQQRWSTAIGSA